MMVEPESRPLGIPRERGYELDRFPEWDEVTQVIANALERADGAARKSRPKAQLVTDLVDPRELDETSAYIRLATRPEIVHAVSAYLGVVPVLAAIDVWYS